MGIRAAHWDDWDLEGLLGTKRALGQRVSLVVPARNEAATVGAVVTRVREALMETVSLVDEIVVVDSDSVDDTPNKWGPNFDKPRFPSASCGNTPDGDMFMNYMDYVDDDTMVM